jgi:NAD(P)-dependent dehydrogenase (short-subunit alcohol dehydrogenase family)
MSDSKVALVTGAASGIGKATVIELLAAGFRVVGTDINVAAGEAFEREFRDQSAKGELHFVLADVSDEGDVERMVNVALNSLGRLDVLVNNAGINGAFGRITDIDVDDWDKTYAVLVRGVFLGIKHGARLMMQAGCGGSIVNTASPAGEMGGLGRLCYSTAKAAVLSLTRQAAVELAPARIRVNAVNPGMVHTPLIGGLDLDPSGELAQILPWPEIGKPQDVARVIRFLASDDADYVTGVSINVDGALTAAGARLPFTAAKDASGISFGTTGRPEIVRSQSESD